MGSETTEISVFTSSSDDSFAEMDIVGFGSTTTPPKQSLQPVAADSPGGDEMGSETTESSVLLSSSDEEMDIGGFGPTTMSEAKMFRRNLRKQGPRKTPTIRPRVPGTKYVTDQARAHDKSHEGVFGHDNGDAGDESSERKSFSQDVVTLHCHPCTCMPILVRGDCGSG
ncbi:unnamed protein product [Zymoseptoria tritici ST99CH_1E4]|uniref:Uncharacterized protein n=1 Tax=Zymoseptoria tritici ST99CH_1E4 TaxID=1276532 RepID=A0A2H1GQ34_ZYMTR|nr:unnamed protein product [Zymoseptoria tritici ST99CH_1E4]